MSRPAHRRDATLADFLAIPEDVRFHEVIDGEIVEKANPSYEHGNAQGRVLESVGPFGRRAGGGSRPGGWWFASEVEVRIREAPLRIVRREVLAAQRGDTVRAEPFEAIEIRVGTLFGDDDEDGDGEG